MEHSQRDEVATEQTGEHVLPATHLDAESLTKRKFDFVRLDRFYRFTKWTCLFSVRSIRVDANTCIVDTSSKSPGRYTSFDRALFHAQQRNPFSVYVRRLRCMPRPGKCGDGKYCTTRHQANQTPSDAMEGLGMPRCVDAGSVWISLLHCRHQKLRAMDVLSVENKSIFLCKCMADSACELCL